MKTKIKGQNFPLFFKSLFWSYNFSSIDPQRDKKTIILNTINYGEWKHWIWIIKFYGRKEVKRIIEETPRTEFRTPALKLISLLLDIKGLKYASRSDYLKSKKIFNKLPYFPNFYVAGETGLAFQLGHRISVDFDLFWQKNIPRDLLLEIKRVFKNFEIKVVVNHLEQLTVAIDGINVSFVKYPFPVISKPIEYQGIKILAPLEIAAMKAYALGRRATLKDYVDLYFVLKEKVSSLEEIIAFCEEKYGSEFNLRLFLEQLIYLEDVEKIEIRFLKERIAISKIERFFEGEVKKIKF